MIIKTKPIKYKLLKTQIPLQEFPKPKISKQNQVMFLRYIGLDSDQSQYLENLQGLDKSLSKHKNSYLKITEGLDPCRQAKRIQKMKTILDGFLEWEKSDDLLSYYTLDLAYTIPDETLEWTKKRAFREVLSQYDIDYNTTPSTRKNFGVKLLYWMDLYFEQLFNQNATEKKKVMFYGTIKKHESYFLILLSKLGCDVMYINPCEDIKAPCINTFSQLHETTYAPTLLPFPEVVVEPIIQPIERPVQRVPEAPITQPISRPNLPTSQRPLAGPTGDVELNYVELATFAESVVMIKVYDKHQKVLGGGSGVVINDTGFIITNLHVVGKGEYYGVHFEKDSEVYYTSSLVKYNQDYDLALIRVDKRTKPIQLSNTDLVRGQKIISIGSPLGLFNTVSEGIVSGFRAFESCDMVQISAPISPGSSGGALINMYGKLVGITTSGFDGQNLNLAVHRKHIQSFAGNIIKP